MGYDRSRPQARERVGNRNRWARSDFVNDTAAEDLPGVGAIASLHWVDVDQSQGSPSK